MACDCEQRRALTGFHTFDSFGRALAEQAAHHAQMTRGDSLAWGEEVEVPVTIRVRFEDEPELDDGARARPDVRPRRPVPCCVCAFYPGGHWFCAGYCCG
jgi:hypothetical protein